MSMLSINGIVPVVPIPFTEEDAIVEAELRRIIDFCVDNHAEAVCLPAYGSEFYKLTEAERLEVVRLAVDQSAGRVPVAGQANHFSRSAAIALARRMEDLGADLISMAAPRMFGLSEDDLLRFFVPVAQALEVPLLIQDWNPGGPTVGAAFAKRLHEECPNFRYLKLEEPLMGEKIQAIRAATNGEVGVLEGWGGMYMMELIPAGICGVMPGVTVLPVLDRVYRLRQAGQDKEAYQLFTQVLPFIVFQLQDMELFLHLEKRLLKALGVIDTVRVREATIHLDAVTEAYGEFLIERTADMVNEVRAD